jgi:hypothetical protein
MAHFAQLDSSNFVMQVIVISNADILDEHGDESEEIGIQFCQSFFGEDTTWKQTSYNNTFRKTYGGIGFYYDQTLDEFVNPWDEEPLTPPTPASAETEVVTNPTAPTE